MKTIVKIRFGSHLYGTNTPDSDTDYRGVFIPSVEDIVLGKIPRSINITTKKGEQKNTKEDVDTEMHSLHHFIKLACAGETMAIDMLHAPDNMIIQTSDVWNFIRTHRYSFYSKNLKAFVGYARRQASKYGIKGSRLSDAKNVKNFLISIMSAERFMDNGKGVVHRLKDVWNDLPEGEHIFKHEATPENNNLRLYEVCGRKFQETCTVSYAQNVVEQFYNSYGARAIQASNNENIDWKAVSHAFRAAFEVKEILTDHTVTFPLKEAKLLLKIKRGELDYKTEVAPHLDKLMEEIEILSKKSNLQEKVNCKQWNDFLVNVMLNYIKGKSLLP